MVKPCGQVSSGYGAGALPDPVPDERSSQASRPFPLFRADAGRETCYRPSIAPPRLMGVQRARAFASRTIRAMKLLARDSRIPKPLRWVTGLALLPIPGPVDEVILLVIAPVLFAFYREPMHEAWQRTTLS